MAEAFLKHFGRDKVSVESAGLDPKPVHPLVVEVMKEVGIDLSGASSDSVFDFFRAGRRYDYVITVCDAADDRRCPTFPGTARRLHWPFPDPEKLSGGLEKKLADLRIIRDDIARKIQMWLAALE